MLAITSEAFPPSDRSKTFALEGVSLIEDSHESALRDSFMAWQVGQANCELTRLQALGRPPTPGEWDAVYESVAQGRHALGIGWKDLKVIKTSHNLLTPITDDAPNRDVFGDLGRLRSGVKQWDEATTSWIGGSPTPAGLAVMAAADRIRQRFEHEAPYDYTLQNTLVLPGIVTIHIDANRLLRGPAAREAMAAIRAGVVRRTGNDDIKFEMRDDFVISETANEINRSVIRGTVMQELGRLSLRPSEWEPIVAAGLAGLLYEAPKYKRGSASVLSVFSAIYSTYLSGKPFPLPPNADLYAATQSQGDFIDYVLSWQ